MRSSVLVTIAAVASVASALPKTTPSCSNPNHPCNTYGSNDLCSKEYNDGLHQCVKSGCIQWFRDPELDCTQCGPDNRFHVCNSYSNNLTCSPEWLNALRACKRTGCKVWKKDPESECQPTQKCDAKDHPCNTYNNVKPQCSDEWKIQLYKCQYSKCRTWIVDPFTPCKPKAE